MDKSGIPTVWCFAEEIIQAILESDDFKNESEQVETLERKQVNLKSIDNSSPSQLIEFMEIDEFENSDQELAELESDKCKELDKLQTS
ncbi:22958_t:CDS:2, partial [Dentiscutata erythropus]